ncbi:MAG: RNA 2',3'-cyclic phosphodiesterase [Nitrospiraceae bacterium]|nr:MAG: RNA 2',3'-cyclic phosphodiesterase [Nitrospiraceae bacterium]
MQTLRSFIAIELPDTVKSALMSLQQELKKCGADVRWARPEGIHLTLKFLGEVEERLIGRIVEALTGTCRKFQEFHCEIRGVGVFPGAGAPRVLWTGIADHDDLALIHQDIDAAMSSLGFERENRKFTPHLTLGRFRSSVGKMALLDEMQAYKELNLGIIDVNHISLMRSDLGPAGAKYTRIAEIRLRD